MKFKGKLVIEQEQYECPEYYILDEKIEGDVTFTSKNDLLEIFDKFKGKRVEIEIKVVK